MTRATRQYGDPACRASSGTGGWESRRIRTLSAHWAAGRAGGGWRRGGALGPDTGAPVPPPPLARQEGRSWSQALSELQFPRLSSGRGNCPPLPGALGPRAELREMQSSAQGRARGTPSAGGTGTRSPCSPGASACSPIPAVSDKVQADFLRKHGEPNQHPSPHPPPLSKVHDVPEPLGGGGSSRKLTRT